jgi:hypothetical protein
VFKKIRPRLTYANVMVTVLMFIVLGGAAYAAPKLHKNSVGSRQLKKKAVTTPKIKNGAVTTSKLGNNAVATSKIAAASVTAAKLAPDAVPVPKAYVRFNSSGAFVPSQSSGVISFTQPVANVACLDLSFTPKTGVASRGVGGGAPPINAAQVVVGAEAASFCGPGNPGDAAVQVAAAPSVQDLTAWFE